jgi:hypothetical protein
MRGIRCLMATAVLPLALAPAAGAAQVDFEGLIAYDVNMGGMNMQITQMVKGALIRQEMQGPMGDVVSITDTDALVVTTLIPAQKMYMRMDMKAMMEQAAAQASQMKPPEPADFKSTGENETIAGHECEHYEFTRDGTSLDICVAQGLGFVPFMSMGNQGAGMSHATSVEEWKKRFPNGFLPLRMSVTAQGQSMTMRATSIDRKSLGADLFKVPDGYTQMGGPGM